MDLLMVDGVELSCSVFEMRTDTIIDLNGYSRAQIS